MHRERFLETLVGLGALHLGTRHCNNGFARALVLATVAFALGPLAPGVEAQAMMGGGGDMRGGREAMSERLANVTPEQRAYLEALREEREGADGANRITLRAGTRRYTSGPSEVSESLGEVTYRLRRRAMTLRVSGEPLRFKSGDTLSIAGISSLDARLDLAVGDRDSLRFVLWAPSTPSGLTMSEVTALSSVGTSTVDLSSIQFGTPAGLEARYTHVQPLGGSVLLSATVGGSHEPRPSENESSYWRGTTMRARVGLARARGLTRVSGGLEMTYSFTDSLAGQNLFQGGGTVLARADVTTLLSDVFVGASASYFRPHSADRPAVGSLREPTGDFKVASALAVWPIGRVFVTPVVVLSHESSESAIATSIVTGSGWSLGTSLWVDIPLARALSLTPEVGHASGSVKTDVLTTLGAESVTQRNRRTLSGWWVAADLSVAF